jgi:hypothetical protein
MADSSKQDGIMAVMMKRFETRWLPDALAIKERVDRGEVLSDWATSYLDEVVKDISQAKSLVDQYPDLQPLYARTARMYREIASTALENETRAPEKPAT